MGGIGICNHEMDWEENLWQKGFLYESSFIQLCVVSVSH